MKKRYEVTFTHVIERYVTCEVVADNEEEAISKAQEGEWEDTDEEYAPEQGIDTENYKARLI
jgi:hypothetical protein